MLREQRLATAAGASGSGELHAETATEIAAG
jgi:hypothetical protein